MELDLLSSLRAVVGRLVVLEPVELVLRDPSPVAEEFQLVRLVAAHRDRADGVDTVVLAACMVD